MTIHTHRSSGKPVTLSRLIGCSHAPLPWSDYDVAEATGTAMIVPTTSAAFTNPTTSDRAAQLATRIEELQAELLVSRAYYGS
jgi:hypothetical protein